MVSVLPKISSRRFDCQKISRKPPDDRDACRIASHLTRMMPHDTTEKPTRSSSTKNASGPECVTVSSSDACCAAPSVSAMCTEMISEPIARSSHNEALPSTTPDIGSDDDRFEKH